MSRQELRTFDRSRFNSHATITANARHARPVATFNALVWVQRAAAVAAVLIALRVGGVL